MDPNLTPPIPPTPPPMQSPAEKVHWGWYIAGGLVAGIILCRLKMKMKCNLDAQKIKDETAKEMSDLFKTAMDEAVAKGETLGNFSKVWNSQ